MIERPEEKAFNEFQVIQDNSMSQAEGNWNRSNLEAKIPAQFYGLCGIGVR